MASAEGGVIVLAGAGRGLGLGDGTGLTHAFPLVARGRLTGVLALAAPEDGLSFEDVELMTGLSSYAAVSSTDSPQATMPWSISTK